MRHRNSTGLRGMPARMDTIVPEVEGWAKANPLTEPHVTRGEKATSKARNRCPACTNVECLQHWWTWDPAMRIVEYTGLPKPRDVTYR